VVKKLILVVFAYQVLSQIFSTYGQDCNGTCNGDKIYDRCGQCLLQSDSAFDSCVGCDGVANSGKKTNPCGYCISNTLANFSTYGQDCTGTCNGNKINDLCGQCLLESDPLFDSCVGCDGIANSGKKTNPCGFCISSTLANFSTYGQDCTGVCNGNKVYDLCGQCLLQSDPSFDSCVGCDGIANSGKKTNPCGYCISSNMKNFTTYGQDCSGTCNGNKIYDRCTQCLLQSDPSFDSCIGCDGVAYSNASWICGVCAIKGSYTYNHACDTTTNITVAKVTDNSGTITVMTTIIIVVVVVALIVVLLCGYVIYRLWKRQQQVDANFKALAQNYQVMEETSGKKKKQ